MIQQLDHTIQQMQGELDDKTAKEQAEQQKAANEAMRLEIERYKAETDRIKAQADAALKANQDLTDSEKVQADMDMQKLLEDMRQDHDIEMAILTARLNAGGQPTMAEQMSANESLDEEAMGETVEDSNSESMVED